MAIIRATIAGDIISEQQIGGILQKGIPAKILGNTLIGLQDAVNRSHIVLSRGHVGKNDRMRSDDYQDCEFIIYALEQNCISFNLFGQNGLINKIISVTDGAYRKSTSELIESGSAILKREAIGLAQNTAESVEYAEYVERNRNGLEKEFEHRSIVKHIDAATRFVRSEHCGDSSITLSLTGERTHEYYFNKNISKNFGRLVNRRSLATVTIVECFIKDILDSKTKANIILQGSNYLRTLIFPNKDAMRLIYPHDSERLRRIYCSPVFEFDTYDFDKGDLYFIDMAE